MWHGRNSYRRSAKLAQFVIHRGLIISVMQAVFSAIFYFAPIALYQGWLMAGYATIYTMAPVFSLVLDRDVNEDLALLYPELYKELTKVTLLVAFWRVLLNLPCRDERCHSRPFSSGLWSAPTKVCEPPIFNLFMLILEQVLPSWSCHWYCLRTNFSTLFPSHFRLWSLMNLSWLRWKSRHGKTAYPFSIIVY